MRAEKILWWILVALFVIGSVLIFFHLLALGLVAIAYPEFASFLIGLFGFWIFANRLIFGYGGLANSAAAFLKGKQPLKKDILAKAKQPIEKLEELSIASLFALWQGVLEPFKYAYYFAFFLVFVCAMLFELDLLGGGIAAIAAKGLMLGAAVPTLLVFGLDLMAAHYVASALKFEEA